MIYFVRHAESQYNAAERQIQKKIGPHYLSTQEYLDQKFSSKYFDVQLTSQGQEQSILARQKVAHIDIDLILVSPLRRALHTCSIIFEKHKSNAPIIVQPAFREIMQSSNDLGTEIMESMLRYPTFDFIHIKHNDWYVDTLSYEADRKNINQKLQGLQGKERKDKCIEECLQLMKQNWSERQAHPEQQELLKQRILPEASHQKAIIKHYLKSYSKIAIVAHSECIKHYAGYKIANCEVFPFEANKL